YTTPCESITRKANFSAGGTIKCAHSKKIAGCALTPYWQAKAWRKNASRPASITKCAAEKTHPITRQYGQSLRPKSIEPRTPQFSIVHSTFDLGCSTFDIKCLTNCVSGSPAPQQSRS